MGSEMCIRDRCKVSVIVINSIFLYYSDIWLKMEGDLKMDILKGKRYDIMNVLWEEGRPLSAFEINDIAPELKMPTVRRCLELLLKENLIQVAGTSMNGKVYARNYTPLLSREDYLKGNAKSRKINPVEMMNALLESDGITVEELEKLQELIDKKRAELESR